MERRSRRILERDDEAAAIDGGQIAHAAEVDEHAAVDAQERGQIDVLLQISCTRSITVISEIAVPTRSSPSRISPLSGQSRHPIRCSSVDFPLPDGPARATSSPVLTESDTSRTAGTAEAPSR